MACEATMAALVEELRCGFVRFPHVQRVTTALDRLYSYRSGREEAENLLLIGESGVGKSTLLKRYVDRYPRIEHEDFTEIPVLYIELETAPTPKKIAGQLLRAMGSPYWNKGTESELKVQLQCLLKACRVKVVIIDEANHLVDRGGEKTLHTTGDWLKVLLDETRIAFVLAGIPRVERLRQTNDQLRGRFREVIAISRFSIADAKAEVEFRSALAAFKKLLKDLPAVDISGALLARSLVFATDGRLREVRRLLVRAVELAFAQSVPKLTVVTLSQAFCDVIFQSAPDSRNPFHKSFTQLPLVGPGEPFQPVER